MDLTWLQPWLVLTHVLSALTFVLFHGASAMVAFRLRSERDPARIRALLELSNAHFGWMYLALAILLLSGIVAGIVGGWWTSGQLWLWASVGLLVVILAGMFVVASGYFESLRHAVGIQTYQDLKHGREAPPVASEAEIAALVTSSRPAVIAVIGLGGIGLVAALMTLKPF